MAIVTFLIVRLTRPFAWSWFLNGFSLPQYKFWLFQHILLRYSSLSVQSVYHLLQYVSFFRNTKSFSVTYNIILFLLLQYFLNDVYSFQNTILLSHCEPFPPKSAYQTWESSFKFQLIIFPLINPLPSLLCLLGLMVWYLSHEIMTICLFICFSSILHESLRTEIVSTDLIQ